jgi:hypothetical protein
MRNTLKGPFSLLLLFTSNRTARIPSMHYNSAGNLLKLIKCIQDKVLIISVFVLSELATCSRESHSLAGLH